jgi:hypothetical protein
VVIVGAGYIRVPHPREYGLAPSVVMEDDVDAAEVYQASFIHQVHCLVRRIGGADVLG